MDYRLLGRTGVKVSPLCLGTLNFGGSTPEAEGIRIIHKALDAGINFIDTANRYRGGESERIVGKALADGRRDKVVLATKFHGPMSEDPNDQGVSRRHIFQAVETSLRRLQTDWIDLYQIHRPIFEVPQDETLRALDDLVRQGKVRYIGSSSFPAWMVMEALAISERYNLARLVTEQPPYNLLDRRIENELVPLALRYNLGLIPWSPLANGILAGRYESADQLPEGSRASRAGFIAERVTPRSLEAFRQFALVAQELGIPPAQLALVWLTHQPGVTAPIFGPRTEAHLDDVLPVLTMRLDPSVPERLDQIVPPGSAVADFHNSHGWMKMQLMIFYTSRT
ncbi:MAG: aldo/keto reductase [Chloroflexi bacterium RBG_16_48_8]|nr:MAG: aldo/keto reductase [Chloroflexi bacterium RBG_16_48_8]